MDYYAMAREYAIQAKNLKNYLSKLKNYYASRLVRSNFTPGYTNIDFRVKKLYDMYLETAYIAKYLSKTASNLAFNNKKTEI